MTVISEPLIILVPRKINEDTLEEREKFILESIDTLIDSEFMKKPSPIKAIRVMLELEISKSLDIVFYDIITEKVFQNPLKSLEEILEEVCNLLYGAPLTEDILLMIRLLKNKY